MITRRLFLTSLPTTGAIFALGRAIVDEGLKMVHSVPDPLASHFHPRGKAPSEHTLRIIGDAAQTIPFSKRRDLEEQTRGLIAERSARQIIADGGNVAFDRSEYDVLDGDDVFNSIHPSRTRIARLNNSFGLYEVTDGIYQVRGFDLSDFTFVCGATGWIVIDICTAVETSRAAWELLQKHVGEGLPITAVICSHTHSDHFGGVRGIVTDKDIAAGRVEFIAPDGFMENTISENVYAGNAMYRRLFYQHGLLLPGSPHGFVAQGLGHQTPAGATSLIASTRPVSDPIEEFEVDGVHMVFQNTPRTEAPMEMNAYTPEKRALWMAENVTALFHNIYTLRGAPERDPLNWSKYNNETLYRFSDESEVIFQSHHWPRWGAERIREILRDQRDLYANMNNQMLHYANQGVTINEINNVYRVPQSLQQKWHCRGYHYSTEHNARGVIQRYLGFWDCSPTTLIPNSPADSAPLYVEMMGGGGGNPNPRPHASRRRRIPLRHRDSRQTPLCRTGQDGGQGSADGCVRAVGLPAEESWTPEQFPCRRLRAALGRPSGYGREFIVPRRDPRDIDGTVPQFPRLPNGNPSGRGPGVQVEPRNPRHRRTLHSRAFERHPDQHRGRHRSGHPRMNESTPHREKRRPPFPRA